MTSTVDLNWVGRGSMCYISGSMCPRNGVDIGLLGNLRSEKSSNRPVEVLKGGVPPSVGALSTIARVGGGSNPRSRGVAPD